MRLSNSEIDNWKILVFQITSKKDIKVMDKQLPQPSLKNNEKFERQKGLMLDVQLRSVGIKKNKYMSYHKK